MSQLLLSLRGLACGYQGHRIVQSLELHLNAGDIGCLLGPSGCLLYTSPSPRDKRQSRMPSSA